jgi:hypothetical protein
VFAQTAKSIQKNKKQIMQNKKKMKNDSSSICKFAGWCCAHYGLHGIEAVRGRKVMVCQDKDV